MNLIRLTAALLLLVVYCAERISPNDSQWDPENTGGDYGFDYTVGKFTRAQLPDSQLSVFMRYPLNCQLEAQKDPLVGYRYSFNPVINSTGARPAINDTGFRDTSWLYFTGPYSGQITVTALKPNGDVISHTDSIRVGNPFRIKTVTGWMKREGNVGLAVIGRIDSIPKELETEKFLVQWLRNGVASDTVNIAEPCILGVQDTSTLSAVIYEKDNSKVSLPLDSIIVTTQNDGPPQVRLTELAADKIKNVRVNEPDTIRVAVSFADSIVWVYNGSSRTGTSAQYVYTPANTALIDTLIVFVKNRFGISSDTDTVLIKAGSYAIRLKASFPDTVAARTWNTWKVEAEANGILVDSIHYRWTVSPKSAVDSIRDTTTAAIRLYCNPNRDVDSFTVGVYAYKDTARSLEISKLVFVHRYRPVLKFKASSDSCLLGETVSFKVAVSDTAGGWIDSVRYRSSFDNWIVHPLQDSTLKITCTAVGTRQVKFWCIDNSGFTSDTANATVNVMSDKCYFLFDDTTIVAYAGDPVRITAPATFPGSRSGSSVVVWKWDVDNNGVWDDSTGVGYFDTLFSDTGSRILRVGCRNNKGDAADSNATIFVDVRNGAPRVDSVYIAKSSVFIREKVRLQIKASDGNGSVQKLVVLWKESDTAATISVVPPKKIVDTTIDIVMNNVGTFSFSVVAVDDGSKLSPVVPIGSIVVLAGRPVVDSVTPGTCWIYEKASFEIAAHDAPGDSDAIDSIAIQWDSGGVWQDTGTLHPRHVYDSYGMKKIRVVVFDTTNMASDTLRDSVFVNQGQPTTTVSVDSANTWVKDEINCTVHADDPHGSIAARFIRWDSTGNFIDLPDSTGKHSYTKAGVHTVFAYSVDNDGISSDTVSINVNVRLGQPSVSIRGNIVSWINDSISVTVSAADSNSNNVTRYIRWDNDSSFVSLSDSVGKHVYLKDSVHTISAYSIDNDLVSSDTARMNIRVRKGAPIITSIVTNPAINSIYINDNIGFRVTVLDSNDLHDSVRVSWLGTTSYTETKMIAVNDTVSFNHLFARDRAGSVSVRFAVVDTDRFMDDTVITFQVQAGAPVVTSARCERDTIWVLDNNKYRVSVADGNGFIRKIIANWNDATPQDTLFVNGNRASVDTFFFHAYDINGGGKTARFQAVDEDSVSSAVRDTGFTVRIGAPALRGDTGDTLWVVVDRGTGNYKIHANASDTNGIIQMRYWDDLQGWKDSSITDSSTNQYYFRLVDMNHGMPFHILARDDDGFKRGDTLIVFADSAPPKPILGSPSVVGDSVKFVWQNADVKDGDSTNFRIICDLSSVTPSTVIKDFATCRKAGSEFYFWYHPPVSGSYQFVVVARDRRGTQSTSLVSSYFNFTKP